MASTVDKVREDVWSSVLREKHGRRGKVGVEFIDRPRDSIEDMERG